MRFSFIESYRIYIIRTAFCYFYVIFFVGGIPLLQQHFFGACVPCDGELKQQLLCMNTAVNQVITQTKKTRK